MAQQGKEAMGGVVKKPKTGVNVPKDVVVEVKSKDGEEKKEAPLPPPEKVEMRVYMHCKECILKVKKILKRFNGVEDVIVDSKMHKVVVKGKKVAADPTKVVEYVQKKIGYKVELLAPIPPPLEEKKEEERKEEPEPPKPEEKDEVNEPPMIQVLLKVHIHCDVCAQWIRMRILKMKGVQSAEVDIKASEVTVKGVLEEAKLAKYVYNRIGKHVSIIKYEPVAPPESTGGDDMANEKVEDGEEKEKEEGDGNTGGEEDKQVDNEMDVMAITAANLYMYYPQFVFAGGYNSPLMLLPPGYIYQQVDDPTPSYTTYASHHQMMAPQTFSDENPNVCSII